MIAVRRSISHHLAPVLLLLGGVLAAVSWYVRPERAFAWTAAMLLIVFMSGAFGVSLRMSTGELNRRRAASLRSAIAFAALIVAFSLGATLAGALGAIHASDLGRRTTMAILGAVLMFTGNAMPKTLTPLSALKCDVAKVQTFQRFAGWTWVLTGLGFAIAWLALPVRAATPVSLALVAGGLFAMLAQVVRLSRTPQRS